jgi:serine palmitoyltransferase
LQSQWLSQFNECGSFTNRFTYNLFLFCYTITHPTPKKVIYFKHNDVADLEKVLKQVETEDKKTGRDVTLQRRFIVSEGLFKVDGTIAPLKSLVDLKNRFGYRLILDECLSFGVLGKTGRGLTEHFDLPVTEVEMIILSLEHGFASIGGLCLGNIEVVDHQRLSGAGYCFSAAAPPFVSTVALKSLNILKAEPKLITQLEKNAELVNKLTSDVCGAYLSVLSDKKSPILIASLTESAVKKATEDVADVLQNIARECLSRGVYIAVTDQHVRVVVRSSLSEKQIKEAVNTLKEACVACVGKVNKK